MKLVSFGWSEKGLRVFIGSLEATILRAMWDYNAPIRIKELHKYLLVDCNVDIAYTTLITTLHRMEGKGFIKRFGTLKYETVYSNEQEFVKACIAKVLAKLVAEYPNQVKNDEDTNTTV